MSTGPDQSAELKFVVTNTLIVGDIQRSVAFYRDVLGATVLREGEPTFLRLGNIWLTIPAGAIIKVVSGSTGDGDRMVDVLWEGRTVTMFADDVDVLGTEITDHSARA